MSLSEIKNVGIDPAGRYKYILIRVKLNGHEKHVVRGYAWAEYHGEHITAKGAYKMTMILFEADILDDFEKKLTNKNVKVDCVGGGRILHEPDKKQLLVYGYSQVSAV